MRRKETGSSIRESGKKGTNKSIPLMGRVAEILRDGKWHYVHELSRRLNQPERIVRDVLRFCADFNVVVLNRSADRARLNWRAR